MVAQAGSGEVLPFLVNLRARRAVRWPRVVEGLAARGVRVQPLLVAEPSNWVKRVAEAVQDRPSGVLLGGGDGSFSRGLAPLAGSGIAIGFVPLGTGNGIARSFGVATIEAACRAIAGGVTVAAGAAKANGHYFLNMTSAGISVEVVRGVSARLKRAMGRGAYPTSIAAAVARRRPFGLHVAAGEADWDIRAMQFIIFNGRYSSRWPMPGVVTPGGGLSICALPDLPPARLAAAVLAFWMGREPERVGIRCVKAVERATITTDGALDANVDGEIITRTPLEVEYLPGVLRVYARGT